MLFVSKAAFKILLRVYGHMDWNAPQPTGDCHEEKNAYYKNKERAPANCRCPLEVNRLFFYRWADNWRMISWT